MLLGQDGEVSGVASESLHSPTVCKSLWSLEKSVENWVAGCSISSGSNSYCDQGWPFCLLWKALVNSLSLTSKCPRHLFWGEGQNLLQEPGICFIRLFTFRFQSPTDVHHFANEKGWEDHFYQMLCLKRKVGLANIPSYEISSPILGWDLFLLCCCLQPFLTSTYWRLLMIFSNRQWEQADHIFCWSWWRFCTRLDWMPVVVDDPPRPRGAALSHKCRYCGHRACDSVTAQSKWTCAIWRCSLGDHLQVTPDIKKQDLLCPTPYNQLKKNQTFFSDSSLWGLADCYTHCQD